MLRSCLASFEPGLRGCWAVVVGTIYVIGLICDSMLVLWLMNVNICVSNVLTL